MAGSEMAGDYLARLQAAYQGEVRGEATFLTLAARAGSDEAAAKWRALARLEATTRARLLPLMRRHGLVTAPDEEQRRLGLARAEARAALGWHGAVRALAESVAKYVALYAELEADGPPEDKAGLAFLTAHEVALAAFARAELAGDAAGALAPVLALLDGEGAAPQR